MFDRTKSKTILMLALISIAVATIAPSITSVIAQNQATVNVLESVGGSTNPSPGTYNYNDGAKVTLTATPDGDLVFVTWLISTDTSNDSIADNSYTLTVQGGVTYTISAVFAQPIVQIFPNPPQTPLSPSAYGTVTILPGLGGSTTRTTGTYYFTSVYKLKLTAVADSGWKFSYWQIRGDTNTTHGGYPFTLTPTDNPYTFDCGLGYNYAFQPVFAPVESTTPPPTTSTTTGISTELLIAIIAIIIAIVAVIASVVYVQRSKKR